MAWGNLRLWAIDLIGGLQIRKVLQTIHAHEQMPVEELNNLRQKKLAELFSIAQSSTEFYAPYKTYAELPVINKETITQNPSAFLSNSFKGQFFKKATGGSTGITLTYQTSALAQSYLWAGLIHSWEVAGYKRGEKISFIAGSALVKSNRKHKIFYKFLNVTPYDAFAIDDQRIEIFVNDLLRNKTTMIFGYAMVMNIIAEYILAGEKRSFPHLKGIVCTSEVMTDEMRNNIQKAFGVKVFNQYGCNEAGIMAYECEQNHLHLISTRCIYEVDTNGALITTDLANDAFIFMKYNTGDIVEFSNQPCSCGRTYPVIQSVQGRMNDVVIDMNNKKFHSNFFNILFRKDPTVKQFQIQFNKEKFTIFLRVDNTKPVDAYHHFVEETKKHLHFKEYDIVINEPFLKANNAKHRYIIDTSKFK